MAKRSSSFLVSIGTAVPSNTYTQGEIAGFMIRYFGLEGDAVRKLSLIYDKSGIELRRSVLADFRAGGSPALFKCSTVNPSLSDRMRVYKREAVCLAADAVSDCFSQLPGKDRDQLKEVTNLITVSCTGMSAPGLDIQLMQQLGLPNDVHRTSVNFMGCYAAFHALRMADSICRCEEDAVVLVCMVELCSIHFQPGDETETLVVNSLFADGAAAAIVTSGKKAGKLKSPHLEICGFSGEVIHDGASYMTWDPGEEGFLMGLDAMVPKVIQEHAGRMIHAAVRKFNLKKEDIGAWAIHPGGRRILEATAGSMNLPLEELSASFNVLRRYGNMSSPTICFVLKEIRQHDWKNKRHIFAAGFGPGITIETALFKPVLND
jgi:predicted naringenin-chalcone synthase